ncbi:hypothetical protein HK097_008500 [Rhizophlyctis rosea]|uniref:ER membrane protein complex subunit 7 beta-sandwich domain-containing protein n=1 Tax=Rhizophlyctis rosea TaxID=64517 RepID=A0AAD5SCZ1_9FUNG|nr:hypothetical protein HK097_008500 [Rhizophlyctis rosea]
MVAEALTREPSQGTGMVAEALTREPSQGTGMVAEALTRESSQGTGMVAEALTRESSQGTGMVAEALTRESSLEMGEDGGRRISPPVDKSFALSALITPTLAATDISGTLATNNILPDLSLLSPETKLILNGGQRSAFVESDGAFTLYNVPDGSHLLEVISVDYVFDKIRIDVSGKDVTASLTLTGTSWSNLGNPVTTPLELSARGKNDFFVPREGFNPASLLSNPMMLMSVVSMGLVFILPKLQPSEEELAAEAAEQQQGQVQGGEGREAQLEPRRQQQQDPDMPNLQIPDVSQMMANWFAPKPQSGPHRK